MKFNILSLAYAAAIWSATGMLLLGIAGKLGIYMGAVSAMMQWHIFFSLTTTGIITGMIEGAFWGFIAAYFFGWLYNMLIKKT